MTWLSDWTELKWGWWWNVGGLALMYLQQVDLLWAVNKGTRICSKWANGVYSDTSPASPCFLHPIFHLVFICLAMIPPWLCGCFPADLTPASLIALCFCSCLLPSSPQMCLLELEIQNLKAVWRSKVIYSSINCKSESLNTTQMSISGRLAG